MAEVRGQNIEVYASWKAEVTPGTWIAPDTNCGYVTSASVRVDEGVQVFAGIGDQSQSRYLQHGVEGDITFLAQDNQKAFAALAYRSGTDLPSSTIGIGSADWGLDIAGAKLGGITYNFGVDQPLEISCPISGVYAKEDANGSAGETALSGNVLDFVSCVLTGGFASLNAVSGTLGMTNALTVSSTHMGAKTSDQNRWEDKVVKEGVGESTGNVVLLLPYTGQVGLDAPAALTVTLTYTVGVNTWVVAGASMKNAGTSFSAEGGEGIVTYTMDLMHTRGAVTQT